MRGLAKLSMAVALAAVASGCSTKIGGGDARIEVDCSMNGMGEGECQFTNTGSQFGYVCGRVAVMPLDSSYGPQPIPRADMKRESAVFCSGKVEKFDTESKSFQVSGARELCVGQIGDWHAGCTFSFEAESMPDEDGA